MRDVGLRSVHNNRRVEVPVMVPDKISYGHVRLSLRNCRAEPMLCRNPSPHAPTIQAQNENICEIIPGKHTHKTFEDAALLLLTPVSPGQGLFFELAQLVSRAAHRK
jgi:hypothetical protein